MTFKLKDSIVHMWILLLILAMFISNVNVVDSKINNCFITKTFEKGTNGNELVWTFTAGISGSNMYYIYVNNSLKISGNWYNNTPIIYNIDYLPIGWYNITIYVTDNNELGSSCIDIVHIIPANPMIIDWINILIFGSLILISIFILLLGFFWKKSSKNHRIEEAIDNRGTIETLRQIEDDLRQRREEQQQEDYTTEKKDINIEHRPRRR